MKAKKKEWHVIILGKGRVIVLGKVVISILNPRKVLVEHIRFSSPRQEDEVLHDSQGS